MLPSSIMTFMSFTQQPSTPLSVLVARAMAWLMASSKPSFEMALSSVTLAMLIRSCLPKPSLAAYPMALRTVYCARSLAAPFLSLAVPLRWSERPSAFFSLSPLREPPASFTRPLALSTAPSALSLLLFLGILTLLTLLPTYGNPYPIGIQLTQTSENSVKAKFHSAAWAHFRRCEVALFGHHPRSARRGSGV